MCGSLNEMCFDFTAYIPNLAPSKFHLFSELNWLGGSTFQTDEDLQNNVQVYLTSLAATFLLLDGTEKRIHYYVICLNLHGDYEEK